MDVGKVHSQCSKMKKELASLQPVHYSYGRCVPINIALDSPWKFPNMPDEICIPCGKTENAVVSGSNCCDMVDVIDNIANVSMDETLDSASLIHDKETAIFSVLPHDDSSVEDLLSIDDDSVVQIQQDGDKDD